MIIFIKKITIDCDSQIKLSNSQLHDINASIVLRATAVCESSFSVSRCTINVRLKSLCPLSLPRRGHDKNPCFWRWTDFNDPHFIRQEPFYKNLNFFQKFFKKQTFASNWNKRVFNARHFVPAKAERSYIQAPHLCQTSFSFFFKKFRNRTKTLI